VLLITERSVSRTALRMNQLGLSGGWPRRF